jgi:uncharacterized membrane protein YkoI
MVPIRALVAALAALLTAALAAAPASAQDRRCLTKAEQRAAVASGQALPLSTLLDSVRSVRTAKRSRGGRELIKASLCRGENGLVYVLTVLSRDGKVTRTRVEATSGKVVEAR